MEKDEHDKVKQIRVDMIHGELFKVVLRWPCFDVFRSPFSVLSFVSVPVFPIFGVI